MMTKLKLCVNLKSFTCGVNNRTYDCYDANDIFIITLKQNLTLLLGESEVLVI